MRAVSVVAGVMLMSGSMFAASNVYEFTLSSIEGKPAPLAAYKGQVVLLVNVASRCGYTPQYSGLEALYRKYKDRGLVVLGFPANNFGAQEPGTDEEIQSFCKTKYDVTFPMYSKVSVKGQDMTPLYQFLTDKAANPRTGGEVRWNFTKFVADKNGRVIARFEPGVAPDSAEIAVAIEKALAQ